MAALPATWVLDKSWRELSQFLRQLGESSSWQATLVPRLGKSWLVALLILSAWQVWSQWGPLAPTPLLAQPRTEETG